MITDAEAFRRGLLLALSWSGDEEGWTPLTDAMTEAGTVTHSRYDRSIVNYRVMKNVKTALVQEGTLEQRRAGKHFELRLADQDDRTERVAKLVADLDKREEPHASLPETPYRVGRDHLLPAPMWRDLAAAVRLGQVDLIVIPRDQKTKIGYWA